MPQLSLGTIEVLGLPAAVEAADVACKTADVKLIGYETTDGMGMVAVKIEGQVSAVTSAVAAASAAAARITKVFATSVIARPSDQLEPVVFTDVTVGLAAPAPKAAAKPAPEPEPVPEPVVEPEPEPVMEADAIAEPLAVEASASSAEAPPVVVEPVETVEPTLVEPVAAPAKPPARRRTSTPKPRTTKK